MYSLRRILVENRPVNYDNEYHNHTVARKGHGISWSVFLLQIFKLEILCFETQNFDFENLKQKNWSRNAMSLTGHRIIMIRQAAVLCK